MQAVDILPEFGRDACSKEDRPMRNTYRVALRTRWLLLVG
jgi:hypothetical protein